MTRSIVAMFILCMFSHFSAFASCRTENIKETNRLAIVIGNGAYPSSIGALKNPKNDASAVSKMLQKLGFSVAVTTDATGKAITDCVEKGLALVQAPQIALLYYSGHGVQINDQNYLVALDADTTAQSKDGFVALQPIVGKMQARAKATLVFLDACRNNPIDTGADGLSVATGRNLKRGFVPKAETAATKQARGLLVAYATSPNSFAFDGDGTYSPFTQAILKAMPTPGFSVQRVMSVVTKDVGEATGWAQTPWVRSSLTTALKLVGETTIEDARSISENWANKSARLLEKGRRREAVRMALIGLPASLKEKQLDLFQPAYQALANAMRSQVDWLPIEGAASAKHSATGEFAAVFQQDANGNRNATLWNIRAKEPAIPGLDASGNSFLAVFSRFGPFLAQKRAKNVIDIWNLKDAKKAASLPPECVSSRSYSIDSYAQSLDFSPNGKRLLIIGKSNYGVKVSAIASTEDGVSWSCLNGPEWKETIGLAPSSSGEDGLIAGSFIDDDRLCLAVADEHSRTPTRTRLVIKSTTHLRILRLSTGTFEDLAKIQDATRISSVSCSSDSRFAAITRGNDGQLALNVFDRLGGGSPVIEAGPAMHGFHLSFSPDNKYVAYFTTSGFAFYDLITHGPTTSPYGAEYLSNRLSGLFNKDGGFIPGIPQAPSNRIWERAPEGIDLVRQAESLLNEDEMATLKKERIKIGLPMSLSER